MGCYMRRSMRFALLSFGLLASAASAQSVSLKYSSQDATTYTFNAGSCTSKVQVTWSLGSSIYTPCSDLTFWSTAGACGETPGASDVRYQTVTQADAIALRTDTFDVPLGELPGFKGATDAGTTCGTEAIEVPHQICGAVKFPTGTAGACTVSQASSLTLTYDTKPPVSPVIESVGAQDGALKVKVSATSETQTVHVDVREQGSADFREKAKITIASSTTATVSGLVNGTTYDVQARAEDAAGNISAPSELAAGTPRRTLGFWARYQDAGGGQRGGGCAATDGLPLLIAGGLWMLRRKRG